MKSDREFLKEWIKQEFSKGMLEQSICEMRLDLVDRMTDENAKSSRERLEVWQADDAFGQLCQSKSIVWQPV